MAGQYISIHSLYIQFVEHTKRFRMAQVWLIKRIYTLCGATACKCVKEFPLGKPQVALLARNGNHIGAGKPPHTLVLDDVACHRA